MNLPVYMDHHATTPVDPRVLEAMMPFFGPKFGNAASRSHRFGWEAEDAVETARKQVAKVIHAWPSEIIFTSGATESDNLAIKGGARANRDKGDHIVTLATEHKAVLDSCHRLEQEGFRVTFLAVGRDGLIGPDDIKPALNAQTILVSVMASHNEIGVIQPITEIGKLCRDRGILFHTDAVQAVGKMVLDVEAQNIDLLSLTAHKIYGPKGTGALYVRERSPAVRLSSLLDGGGHERGLRSGTLNVPGIVGLGKACELCAQVMSEESERLARLRDRLRAGIFSRLDDVHINGSMARRLPNNLNLSFAGAESDALLMSLPDVALSAGSACTSAHPEPSYILKALGLPDELAYASLRFGLGRFNTEEEVDFVAERVAEAVTALRTVGSGKEKL